MRKLKIYTLCLFLFIVFLILVAWCFVVSTRAQEECGEWIKPQKVSCLGEDTGLDTMRSDGSIRHCTFYCIPWPDDLPPLSSVWVKKPCPATIPVVVGLSDTATVREAKVETVYVFKPCPDTSSGDWYYELKLEADKTLWIRLDTMWQAGDIVWRKR